MDFTADLEVAEDTKFLSLSAVTPLFVPRDVKVTPHKIPQIFPPHFNLSYLIHLLHSTLFHVLSEQLLWLA